MFTFNKTLLSIWVNYLCYYLCAVVRQFSKWPVVVLYCLIWLSSLMSPSVTYAQQQSFVDLPTPTAATLGEYGQVPVSYFNGLPSISVPIHQFKYKGITVPISLDYHAGGNRTESTPSWVGLGWNLSAGGAITRQVNGLQDEISTYELNTNQVNAYPVNTSGTGYGYYDQSIFDNIAWTSSSALDQRLIDDVNKNVISYGRVPYDGEADEFMFNAGDLSGSFFLIRKQDGSLSVKVKSKSGEPLKIEPTISTNTTINITIFNDATTNLGAPAPGGKKVTASSVRTFLGFDITRADGTKYSFGSNISNGSSLSAIDFNVKPNGSTYLLLATSWYLTRITAPDGYAVNLEYKNYGDVFSKRAYQYHAMYYKTGDPNCYHCIGPGEQVSYILQHPSYLARINAPDGTGVEFKSSVAQELNYEHNTNPDYLSLQYGTPQSWDKQIALSSSKWLKLDSIRIRGVRTVALNYNNVSTERLRLLGMTFFSLDKAASYNYNFVYNSTMLPNYNSYRSDNWGFYNGLPYDSYITNYGFNSSSTNNLYTYRVPDESLMKAETLEKIIYPTGGETAFFFEPHDYSKYINISPVFGSSIVSTSTTQAGGLRIKRIEARTSASDTNPQVWEYQYLNADNTSSGILSGIPTYHVEGNMYVNFKASGSCGFGCGWSATENYVENYFVSGDSPQAPLSATSGNHITYSRVIERRPGNGYTIYTYSDAQTFDDQAPTTAIYNTTSRLLDTPLTSRELERGLLLSSAVYDESGRILKSTLNEYNNEPTRYDDFVKMVHFSMVPGANNWLTQATAYKVYTFTPYLQRQSVTDFGNGTTTPLVTRKTYTYNTQRLVATEVTTDSRGQDLVTTYRYPFDFPTSSTSLRGAAKAIAAMPSLHMLQYPVETVITRAGSVINATVQTYAFPGQNTTLIKPYQLFQLESLQPSTGYSMPRYITATDGNVDFVPDQQLQLKQTCASYDLVGNLLRMDKPGQASVSYVWDYSKALPVAMALNAMPSQLAYAGFEADVPYQCTNGNCVSLEPNNWQFDPTLGNKTHLQISGGVTGRGFYRLDGTWSVNRSGLPTGDYEISFWAKGGYENVYVFVDQELSRTQGPPNAQDYRLVSVRVHVSSGNITIDAYGRQVDIDDIRLYPVTAQMTTYTHTPQVGITSMSDVNNQPTRYEYDGLQRLRLVRDAQGNIVKHLDYHYQQ